MTRTARRIALFLSLVAMATVLRAVDSVPTTPEELWGDFPAFDKKAPLDTEILKTWEEEGIGSRILRRFRGQNNGQFRYYAFAKLPKSGWNTVRLKPDDFQNIYGEKLDDWHKVMAIELGDAASLANDKKKVLPRAGKKAVAAIPTDVSSWGNYTQTTDNYAKDNVEKKSGGNACIRNLRWEGGEYVQRPKHWEKD